MNKIHEKLVLDHQAMALQLRAFSRFAFQSAIGGFPIKLTIEADGIKEEVELSQTRSYPVNEILHTLATNLSGYALMCLEWADQYQGPGEGSNAARPAEIAPDGP
jgi:hypothetical protein